MQLTHKKTIETIIASANHYVAAVKGNQPKLYQAVRAQFIEHDRFNGISKGTRNEVSPVVEDDDLPHSRL